MCERSLIKIIKQLLLYSYLLNFTRFFSISLVFQREKCAKNKKKKIDLSTKALTNSSGPTAQVCV